MELTAEDIESITNAVWQSILGEELITVNGSDSCRGGLQGLVSISGAYNGIISLRIESALVRGAASVMFGIPADQVSDDDMTDAVAELTNMVGGNLKCLVDQPSQLGLPKVEKVEEAQVPQTDSSLTLRSQEGKVVVQVQASAA